MIDIYNRHMQEEGVNTSPRERLPVRAVDEDEQPPAYRRTATDPLVNRFQRLPNPDLEMHVFPHLANGKYPIPGYVTVFPLYESIQYALPGEVAPRRSEGRVAPVQSSTNNSGAEALMVVKRLNPALYRVGQDFRSDFAKECDAQIDDQALVRLLTAAQKEDNLHDISRRYAALNAGERAYVAQREKLACRDVKRALVDLQLAAR